jgi:hypothetical protein
MQENFEAIRKRISDAYEAADWNLSPKVCWDIGFHMADWLKDYEELGKVFDISQNLSGEEIRDIIAQFLIHAANHIAAAKKLAGYGPMEDIFGAGIFEEDEFDEIVKSED